MKLSKATVIQVWLASRAVLAIVAAVVVNKTGATWEAVLSRWDVAHFVKIATYGYQVDFKEIAFFPGMPVLMKGGLYLGIPPYLTGVIISSIATLAAALALYHMGGAAAASLWLISPLSVFTAVGYTEAVFCALAFWAWIHAKEDRWMMAALLASLACFTRISGLFLVGALGVLAVTYNLRGKGVNAVSVIFSRLVLLIIPLLCLGIYATYLHDITGSWTAWLSAQEKGWGRTFVSPIESIKNTWAATSFDYWQGRDLVAWVFRAELVSFGIGVITAIGCLFKRWWAESAFIVVQLLAFSISFWLMSINRATLLWFPLFIGLGAAATWRPRRESFALVWTVIVSMLTVLSVLLMVGWAWLFFTGQWAS